MNSCRSVSRGAWMQEFDLEATLEEAGVGIWHLDAATQHVHLSPACAELFGLAGREHMTLEETQMRVHPDDRGARHGVITQALAIGGRYELDYRVFKQGRAPIWLRSRGEALTDARGRIVGLRGVVFSIDKQKRFEESLQRHEEHLRAILDTAPVGVIVIDESGEIASFNAMAERLFGYLTEEICGQNISCLMPEPERGCYLDYMDRYRRIGDRKTVGARRHVLGRRRDGSTFPMELSMGQVQSGGSVHFTGFVTDVTERQKTQARLQELHSDLAHVSRLSALGEMATTLAHELNQPLAAIGNYVDASRRFLDSDDPEVGQKLRLSLDKASEQANRAAQIIGHLREFARRGKTKKKTEHVGRLICDAVALALVGTTEQGIHTLYDLDPAAKFVIGDRIQIEQILVNLLRNAIDAMHQSDRRELFIRTRIFKDRGMVDIAVSDTGPGISRDFENKIFQPFATTKPTGLGIGLSISRTIAEAHGGYLIAEKHMEVGASFHLGLPAGGRGKSNV